MNIDLDESLLGLDFENTMIKDYGNGIILSKRHIEVLNRYDIDYKKYSSLSSIIFEIEDIINNGYFEDELELISRELSEIDYYHNTNK